MGVIDRGGVVPSVLAGDMVASGASGLVADDGAEVVRRIGCCLVLMLISGVVAVGAPTDGVIGVVVGESVLSDCLEEG